MGAQWIVLFSLLICVWRTTAGHYDSQTCDVKWKKVGCYHDKGKDRALPEELANDRDKTSKHYITPHLDWKAYPETTFNLVCECAKMADARGYRMFGLQFFGECWSGPNSEATYDKHDPSDKCKDVEYNDCEDDSPLLCVGDEFTNYVYEIVQDIEEPIDGGFSKWSEWSECSASCNAGKQHRTRTCTNPEPQYGGKECVGLTEEIRECNCHSCESPPECRMVMDFGIIVDTSRSIKNADLTMIREMLEKLISDFDISRRETQVALITYSTQATLQFRFNKYFRASQIIGHIQKMKVDRAGTRTDRAIKMAADKMFKWQLGRRQNVPGVLMTITDGRTNYGSKPYPEVLNPLKRLGVMSIAVGVGSKTNDMELQEIAMDKKDNVIHMDSYDQLKERLQSMMKKVCHGIRARFSSSHYGK